MGAVHTSKDPKALAAQGHLHRLPPQQWTSHWAPRAGPGRRPEGPGLCGALAGSTCATASHRRGRGAAWEHQSAQARAWAPQVQKPRISVGRPWRRSGFRLWALAVSPRPSKLSLPHARARAAAGTAAPRADPAARLGPRPQPRLHPYGPPSWTLHPLAQTPPLLIWSPPLRAPLPRLTLSPSPKSYSAGPALPTAKGSSPTGHTPLGPPMPQTTPPLPLRQAPPRRQARPRPESERVRSGGGRSRKLGWDRGA